MRCLITIKLSGLLLIGLILAACQTSHFEAGSGYVYLSPSAEAYFQHYLARPDSEYFAVSTDGRAAGYSFCEAGRYGCIEGSGTVALRACHRVSNGVPCKIYAVIDTVVWQGVKRSGQVIKPLEAKIGSGPITLKNGPAASFIRYKELEDPQYFSVSADGAFAGYSYCQQSSCMSEGLKELAVARCKGRSSFGSDCYIYAVKQQIVWK